MQAIYGVEVMGCGSWYVWGMWGSGEAALCFLRLMTLQGKRCRVSLGLV